MSMTTVKMKDILQKRLANKNYETSYNRDKDTFRIEWAETKRGITIRLPNVVAKYNERGDEAIDELIGHVNESLKIMNEKHELAGKEKNVYPVIRATSFPLEMKTGDKLVYKDHTAETRIFYALDLGKSYRLIDESLLDEEGWTKERLDEIATFNVRSLTNKYNKDTVAGNDFYFVATQDGYDASRILNESFLEEMKANAKGELAISVPHQDVLILADVQNQTGYDILAQMTMKFFAEGRIPITSLSFTYDDKTLTPIFILAKNKPKHNRKE